MSNTLAIILLIGVVLPVLMVCILFMLRLSASVVDRFSEDCDDITDNTPHTSVRVLK